MGILALIFLVGALVVSFGGFWWSMKYWDAFIYILSITVAVVLGILGVIFGVIWLIGLVL